jgi:hypothetical protein
MVIAAMAAQSALRQELKEAKAEIKRLRAALIQVRGFAAMMDESNWRDLKTHISRQCAALEQGDDSSNAKTAPPELEALLWAWTNAMGRLPDRNTMSETEIGKYWEDYGAILKKAILKLTGMAPDDYLFRRAPGQGDEK